MYVTSHAVAAALRSMGSCNLVVEDANFCSKRARTNVCLDGFSSQRKAYIEVFSICIFIIHL